ncbi:S41 family peptidase [Roseisolibacter agri]|uniref:Tricorn protease homolog n=1 Tax=Roseisolibacter agri TaxID=2014610 RepID=A0AA37Q875_9BACT|nr:S41 family peptidase [Roseisolibacter agri]GLC28384.1 peptidase S41 [Roseisolibacter agri]
MRSFARARTLLALSFALPVVARGQGSAVPARPALSEPSLSPDGREIAFVSGGDVWTVGADGGEARLLVSHPATEGRPLWSPDGKRLAFVSTRTGNGDVYVLELATGALRRVTFDDVAETLDAWSRDGRWLYLSTSSRDVAGMQDVLRVSADGGTPMVVAGDRYASEYWAAPAPDGATLAITARGTVSGQWWRRGHSHIDESEIWLVRPGTGDAPAYTAITSGGAKDAWPMWAADARTLYFMSDRSGAENLWAQPMEGGRASGAPRQVTRFTDGRVLWPSIAHDGRAIVFERDFGVWKVDLAGGAARAVAVTLRGAPATPGVERQSAGAGLQELALSPDGRKLAFAMRGEVFAAASRAPEGAAGGGGPLDAARVTATPGPEQQLAWSPDSRRLAYASDRGGRWRVWVYDFAARRETALTAGAGESGDPGAGDVAPRWSPDGRSIAFVRGGRELRVVDATPGATFGRERRVATARFDRPPFADPDAVAWSPDGQWIAYVARAGDRAFSNAFVARADGTGEPRQVSFLPNAFTGDVKWSPDGTTLFLVSGQRTEQSQVARIDLVPRTPRFREDQFRSLFDVSTPQTPAAPVVRDSSGERRAASVERADSALARSTTAQRSTPNARRSTRIDFDGIRTRLSLLPTGLDVQAIAPSPDGRQLLLVASAAGQTNLWLWPLDELAPGEPVVRQITSTSGGKGDAQWSPDGREIYYRESGRPNAVTVESRAVRSIALAAEMDVDFTREKDVVFAQAWGWLRDHFYDDKYHGADWDAVRARVAPAVAGARTPDDLRRVLSLMVGELNASHLGVQAPGGAPPTTGRLGVRFDRAAYERDGTLRVAEVLPLGPAALAGVRVGDAIVAVGDVAVARGTSLDSLLTYTAGRRVALTLAGEGGARREVAVRPVTTAVEKGLLYRAWVESRREYVAKASGGKLGYVHMPDMGAGSLAQLYADLDAENLGKEGVVVDLRNNNGGFVNAYALDVFTRRPYLTMRLRGDEPAPARAQLGQRALERPTVLVVNQHSLSDAEDFTEGYRALGLGKIVGEPTAGWIIYTWNMPMLDGSVLRLPRTRITGADGTDMELNPRRVDVGVKRPVGEAYTGRDAQLDAAVRVLLSAPVNGGGR